MSDTQSRLGTLSPEPSCWVSCVCFFFPLLLLLSFALKICYPLSVNCVMLNSPLLWNIWMLATKSCLSLNNRLRWSPSHVSTGEWRRNIGRGGQWQSVPNASQTLPRLREKLSFKTLPGFVLLSHVVSLRSLYPKLLHHWDKNMFNIWFLCWCRTLSSDYTSYINIWQ